MSILSNLSTQDVAGANAMTLQILKGRLARDFWEWYLTHEDDKVASVGVLLFSITVRVKTLKPFWIIFFGHPATQSSN
jgi:hypothetical protein